MPSTTSRSPAKKRNKRPSQSRKAPCKSKKDTKQPADSKVTNVGGKTFADILKDLKSPDRSDGAQALKLVLMFGPGELGSVRLYCPGYPREGFPVDLDACDWMFHERWVRVPETWDSTEDALWTAANNYRRNRWLSQGVRVEVWLEKETLAGTRGGEEGGVAVHSIRLPGLVADQEVIFGLPGQTLTISHRTTSREAYIPGLLLAIRKVTSEPRFYRGLDELLGLHVD